MSEIKKSSALVLGSGPAGYTAAIYLARSAVDVTLVSGMQVGGQLSITTDVENYPGFADAIQGPWLMEQMHKQCENLGVNILQDHIKSVKIDGDLKVCEGESGTLYSCKALVISTGASAKWLGIQSETKFQGFGVSGCATCDGFFYKNKEVMVVGGGNTAIEEALYLTSHASKVTLIHRRDELRGEKILQQRLMKNKKVHIIWDTVLEEVLGDDNPKSVTGARLKNIKTGKVSDIDVLGVFIAIGHVPNTSIFKDIVKMDSEGYILTSPDSTKTNQVGVFASGDVQDKVYRQAVTAAGTGCMAALEAAKYLAEL